MRTFLVALVCLAAVLGASQPAQAQSCTGDSGCLYQRPAQRPALPLDHPRLARSSSAGSRTPEQVHLAFAGPGAYAVSWATHPLDGLRLEGEGEAAAAAGGLGAASRRLAAAGAALEQQQQPNVGSAAAGDEEEADASEQLGRRHHRRHRRKHRTCEAVRKAAGRSVVQYGTEPGEYPHTVESHEEVGCYSSGRYLSGALHRVILGAGLEGPLPPNTTIYYRCGDPSWDEEGGDASGSGDSGWSEEFSFRTAPLTGAPGALPYRLGLIGDLGQSEHSVSTLDHLDFNAPDSIILTGDLSYADGYQPRWDTWQRLVAPHTSRQVWMYTVGNHEIELTNGVKGFVSYESRFYFPYRQSLSESKLYYSYDVAGAHVIMLSSYSDYARASEQYAWLLRDLAAVDRSRTPWLLVVMHAPWYNSNYAHQGEGDAMQESMEALLYEHGVDMIFSGHVHAYERHHRVFQGKLDRCAPIHINIGDGGNKEGPDMKYFPQPKYSAFREPSFGHGTLDLMDATHAEWRWHRNQDDGPDIADSLSIVRDPDCKGHARSSSGSGGGSSGGASAAAAAATAADAPQQEAQQEAQQQQHHHHHHHHHSHRCFWRRLRRWAAHTAGLLGWPA